MKEYRGNYSIIYLILIGQILCEIMRTRGVTKIFFLSGADSIIRGAEMIL